jgi:hypothetical protein
MRPSSSPAEPLPGINETLIFPAESPGGDKKRLDNAENLDTVLLRLFFGGRAPNKMSNRSILGNYRYFGDTGVFFEVFLVGGGGVEDDRQNEDKHLPGNIAQRTNNVH